MGVELDIFAETGQKVTGPDHTFATVLAELTLSGKNLRHARSLAARCCASHRGSSLPSFALIFAKLRYRAPAAPVLTIWLKQQLTANLSCFSQRMTPATSLNALQFGHDRARQPRRSSRSAGRRR
jgi:hypothetical protein